MYYQNVNRFKFLFLIFGLFLFKIESGWSSDVETKTQAQLSEASAVAEKPKNDDGLWVEVEPNNLLPSDVTGVYYLVPYKNRRNSWGYNLTIGYSSFSPTQYEPNFLASNYKDVYSVDDVPMIEIGWSIKRNFFLGSIGTELESGYYKNISDLQGLDSVVSFIPIRIGLTYFMDSIWHEPYLVPYISGGAYSIIYKEVLSETNTFGGNTFPAPFFKIGVQAQLNWFDQEAARVSYIDSGIENTFIYLEGRMHMASQNEQDPDFSTGLDWGAGMRFEY